MLSFSPKMLKNGPQPLLNPLALRLIFRIKRLSDKKSPEGTTGRYLLDALPRLFRRVLVRKFPGGLTSPQVWKKVALFENPDFRTQRKNFAQLCYRCSPRAPRTAVMSLLSS